MTRILILGATSEIAIATARRLAKDGVHFVLVGRNEARLDAAAAELRKRGALVQQTVSTDLRDRAGHEAMIRTAETAMGGLDLVLVAHGVLPDQQACEASSEAMIDAVDVNFLSAASLLTHCARVMDRQRRGCIVVIGSVAGDRGRQSNYVYGAAKAGLHTFTQGLRNRLHPSGVRVITVKPGFVDTPMTSHLPKNRLYARPEAVAARIERAVRRGPDVVYAPGFWRWVMLAIRIIPEALFKRLRL